MRNALSSYLEVLHFTHIGMNTTQVCVLRYELHKPLQCERARRAGVLQHIYPVVMDLLEVFVDGVITWHDEHSWEQQVEHH